MSVNDKMTAIANNIRQYTKGTDKLNLDQMAQGIHDVYTKGGEGQYNEGHSDGWSAGYKDGTYDGKRLGKQEQYDAFWDNFQQNGTRTDYTGAFGACWTAETFRPKYPIRPTNAYFMFFNNNGDGMCIDDFVVFSKEHNIVLDYSQCARADYGIGCLVSKHYGVLDFSNCTAMSNLFYSHHFGIGQNYGVRTIDEFRCSEKTVFNTSTFQHAVYLTNITFDGVIATDINFASNTKLTEASIRSIIEHLSTTTTGKTLSLSKSAVNAAFTTAEFEALKAPITNWTFSLV